MTPATRTALRWLVRAVVVSGFGAVGVALWPADDLTPATLAEKQAALQKFRCPGDICEGLLLAPAGQCVALTTTSGSDPTMDGTGDCPGDSGFSLPVAGERLRRLLACARRDGALDAWVALHPPGQTTGQCGVHLLLNRQQLRAWIERLDASQSTALVSVRLADMPAALKRGAGRWHTFAGIDPTDDTDTGSGIELEDTSLDGGTP